MIKNYVLGLDQGTGGTKAVVFDRKGNKIALGYKEVPLIYPKPGWVEQDPDVIWKSAVESVDEALKKSRIQPSEIAAIGTANQGETVLVWDKQTGRPVYNAIVWRCRRSADMCEKLKSMNLEEEIKNKTGLIIDPYFSATKIRWILQNVKKVREKAERGEVLCGATDTWLLWNLTRGRSFFTDYATASRTMMFNIHSLQWDKEILEWLDIPETILATPRPNSQIVGYTNPGIFYGEKIPISNMISDGSAALFGQACFEAGMINMNYGTGCFILMNIGKYPISSHHGLPTTIAWSIDKKVEYALYGSIYTAGAAVRWLRDGLKIIEDATETEEIAMRIKDTGGVYIVPAFEGIAVPYWDKYARGTIVGITGGTTREHIVRAVLEAIAYQVYDVLNCVKKEWGNPIKKLRVAGGPVANKFLMQFQSDILNIPLEVPRIKEATSFGTAFMAGLAVGFWKNKKNLDSIWQSDQIYKPLMNQKKRECLLRNWKKAVQRSLKWEENK